VDKQAQEVVAPNSQIIAVRYTEPNARDIPLWLLYRTGATAWEALSSLTLEDIELFGQGGHLGVLSSLAKTRVYVYLGIVCGVPLAILERDSGDDQYRLAVLEPAVKQVNTHVLLTGSLEAIGATIAQDRHHGEIMAHRLARV
jgi:hypothetical protein